MQEGDFYLVFHLPEGRLLSLRFEGWRGLLLDNEEEHAGFGALTAIRLPDEVLQPIREAAAVIGRAPAPAPPTREREHGGRWWRPVVLAGVLTGLVVLAAVARRRHARGAAEPSA